MPWRFTFRPVARPARGLAPTASNRRPATVDFIATVVIATAARAKKTALGMPTVTPPAMDSRRLVVRRGDPAEMARTPAYSRALVPSVATIGLSRSHLIR